MKAVVFKKDKINISEIDQPVRKSGEALIKIIYTGICNTDIEIIKGYMNYEGILGHEFVGRVVESDDKELHNKRVVGEINFGCGNCSWCLSGMSRHCPNRSVLGILNKNGAMAEYLTLPKKNLFVIPDSVTNKQAVFTEPIAAAFEILEQIHIQPNDEVLLLGDGKLGQLIARVLNASGFNLTVVGKTQSKLNLLNEKGIHTKLLDDFEKNQFPIVIEATGNIGGFDLAMQCTQPRGTLVLKSTIAAESGMNLAPIVINEINMIGSRCGPFKPALDFLEKNRIQVDDLISAKFPASETEQAFEKAKMSESLKVLIKFDNE